MFDVQFDEGIFGYKGLHPQDNVSFEHTLNFLTWNILYI